MTEDVKSIQKEIDSLIGGAKHDLQYIENEIIEPLEKLDIMNSVSDKLKLYTGFISDNLDSIEVLKDNLVALSDQP